MAFKRMGVMIVDPPFFFERETYLGSCYLLLASVEVEQQTFGNKEAAFLHKRGSNSE